MPDEGALRLDDALAGLESADCRLSQPSGPGAVAAAHALLVILRDLKPSNILVDHGGRVRRLDFGIAQLIDDEAPGLTREGVLALKPRHAAPEQFEGAAGHGSRRLGAGRGALRTA